MEGTVDAHQGGLRGRALVGAIGPAVLADAARGPSGDHGWANHPLGVVVLVGHTGMIQERE
ncbi:MAG: hypothetical protein MUO75_02445, partial [Actinobacteria bacterium]|nr:hypothetical protein [Actinomycetota bacterium]